MYILCTVVSKPSTVAWHGYWQFWNYISMGMGNVQQCAVAVSGRPYTPLTLVVTRARARRAVAVCDTAVSSPCRSCSSSRGLGPSGRVGLLSSPLLTVTVLSSVVGRPSQAPRAKAWPGPQPEVIRLTAQCARGIGTDADGCGMSE